MASQFSKEHALFLRSSENLKRAVRVRAAELGTSMELVALKVLCDHFGMPNELPV